ncbi:hypothetical protein [Actinoplanes friuliensis]|uniref:Uncharacterized protein n=1 Tax=Actinoplanes friuliensis DSM 7358 TaxID=1246995 RepID=U5VZI4_9ACTN|nr:hypothetical protein [Actinoplanes friuliensis]AGZ42182.1 hypothetical protein AFR_19550 [Actinoplanes friuliensis DSM 7358]
MHGITGDPSSPQDWPEPGHPLPGDEPTLELPVVTAEMLAADTPRSTPTLAQAALTLALTGADPQRSRRVPALGRLGRPRSGPAPLTEPTQETPQIGNAQPGTPQAGNAQPETPQAGNARLETPQAGNAQPGTAAPGTLEPASADAAAPGRRWLIGAGVAAVALLLTGATVIVLGRDGSPPADGGGWSPPVAAAAAAHTATAALEGRTTAGFDLIDGAKRVTVRAADLGDSLYRISTPETGTVVPRADEQDGRVRLRLDGDAQAVEVLLNAAVLWDLRMAGGADLSTIDLSAGRVGGVDLTGGAGRIALTLPRPDGTLNVRMSGGVSLFDVRTAGAVPVRVRVGSGAGQVTVDGRSHAGVAAGRTFTPDSWDATANRVDVDAAAGMSALTVAPY